MYGEGHFANKVREVGELGSGRCTDMAWGLVLLVASNGDSDLMGSKQELIVKYSRIL